MGASSIQVHRLLLCMRATRCSAYLILTCSWSQWMMGPWLVFAALLNRSAMALFQVGAVLHSAGLSKLLCTLAASPPLACVAQVWLR